MSQYQIDCHECDKVVDLIAHSNDDFECPGCGKKFNSEDGVLDVMYAQDMYSLYKGAKLAGLINDPDIMEEHYHG